MKILLVSNMYPSAKYPHYGVFVKNTEDVLCTMPDATIHKAVLTKKDRKLGKLVGYALFYLNILGKGIFGKYDIIYAHFISHASIPLQILRKLGVRSKIILNAHGNDVVADTQKDIKWVALSRKIIPYANHIIVPSMYYKQVMQQDFGVPGDKLLVYPSGGINTNVFYPREVKPIIEKYGLDPQKKYIGYISRIDTDKGWDTFLQATAQLSHREDLGFIVAGDGAEKPAFDALAHQLGIEDRFCKFPLLSQAQIAELYSILDVFCFPTRRKSDSLGLVGLEAMACGCTVLASNNYGPASYIEDGVNGFSFDPQHYTQLAEKILRVIALSDMEKKTLQQGMAATTAQYSKQSVDKILLNFFLQKAN